MPLAPPLTPPPRRSSSCLLCTYLYMNRALRVHWRLHLKEKPLVHTLSGCSMSGIWKKTSVLKKRRDVCVCVCIRQSTVHQQSALRLPAAWCGDWDATCQKVRGLAEWLHITLSAPATSHLYCDANPWPVPDGAFPASWVHRNMIIYPKHFSSL